jgi:mono/diheme cytochrome c family protein
MLKSISLLFTGLIATSVMATSVLADIEKGQKLYLKTCKTCHGNGTKGASMKTQEEWNDLFANDGAEIIKKHTTTPAKPFFDGDGFKSQSKDMRDFLFEYGSDSGNVPTC